MSGFDPEAIFDAIADLFTPAVKEQLGVDVYAFVPAAPHFPALGLFPGEPFVDYWGTFGPQQAGTLNLELRTAFTYGAEDSLRHLYQLLASGSGHERSIIDVLEASRNPATGALGGLVADIHAGAASIRMAGEENAGMFEAVIPVMVLMRRVAG